MAWLFIRVAVFRVLAGFVCLVLTAAVSFAASPEVGARGTGGETGAVKERADAVFAVSWQPAFCETRPQRPECRDQTADRFDATHFSLHGLWPVKKRYCGVAADLRRLDKSGKWSDLPKPDLDDGIAGRLLVAMPGVRSGLERHQWVTSGTCQTASAEAYFSLQLRFLDAVNGSAVRSLFADKLGQEVTEGQVKAAFDAAFGAGAGERVRLRCAKDGGRSLVSGLTMGLSGEIGPASDLAALVRAAPATESGCRKGIVDAAGLQ